MLLSRSDILWWNFWSKSFSHLDEGVVVSLGIFKLLDASGTFGGMRTLEVEDLTILVVVIVIGESLKLLLLFVKIGLVLLVLSSAGKFAAFLKHVIQLFLIPSVMAENTIFLPSKVCIEKPKFRGRSVFSTCCTNDKSMIPSKKPLLSAFGSR